MKLASKIAILFMAVLTTGMVNAQEKTPKSPKATATGTIGGATITINYNSPFVKGRTIYGKLVPYGKVWRAGADDATTFETSKAIKVEGKELPAGKYAFFVIPEKDGTATVIFNKEAKQWGAYDYKEAEDALRVKVKTKKSASLTESLVYKVNKSDVTLSWENLDIPVAIK
ncbi:DUF2911 domain-containing protein [Flavobacterium subsaxonicum]|uniref:Asparagine synthetase B n=1 Tax=Flavobacterium subsaxonicum WB 4.1-42 = DSM 21790 TaxID=1121898 RepID=A0A0A2MTF3_9FLAO|nr:DUF2911 domain-containing protein [Flavobacterium subsaxonicum]KGO94728.1 hypothetical protein Q766_01035 [Flavobacterium subsaxonicum WB 4.1-42 = DSM 21790]